jgi:murein DD-endopeptidase MepM/ murein hydrolase activator NlpD
VKLPWPIEGGSSLHPITRAAVEHEADNQKPALDFGSPTETGDWCIANFDGTVRYSGYDSSPSFSAGYFVEVEGWVDGHHLVAGWCHLSATPVVASDNTVVAGQRLGSVGWSGYVIPPGPAGAHLHYKLTVDGVRVDPALYLEDTQEDTMDLRRIEAALGQVWRVKGEIENLPRISKRPGDQRLRVLRDRRDAMSAELLQAVIEVKETVGLQ